MEKFIPACCYQEYGVDLKGCNTRQIEGCLGCKSLIEGRQAPCGLPNCEFCNDYPCMKHFGPQN
jgi:hypothetical protein